MATLADALAAYRIFAQAEGKSPKTVLWIMSAVTYFSEFMGQDGQDIEAITGSPGYFNSWSSCLTCRR